SRAGSCRRRGIRDRPSARSCFPRRTPGTGISSAAPCGSITAFGTQRLLDRPHFDGTQSRRRPLRCHAQRLVEIGGLDQEEAAELLLGLGERAVGDGSAAVAHLDRRGGARALQRLGRDQLMALPQRVDVLERLGAQRVPLVARQRVELGLLLVSEAQVFHWQACSIAARSSFTDFITTSMTRSTRAGSLPSSILSSPLGTTCQDKPNLSLSQPH